MYVAALRFELEGCKALARTTCIRAWDRVKGLGFIFGFRVWGVGFGV